MTRWLRRLWWRWTDPYDYITLTARQQRLLDRVDW